MTSVQAAFELPSLAEVSVEHSRTYRLHGYVAGDAPRVHLMAGRCLRPAVVIAQWVAADGPWRLHTVWVEGPELLADGREGDLVSRAFLAGDGTVPRWLRALLDREDPAGVVGS